MNERRRAVYRLLKNSPAGLSVSELVAGVRGRKAFETLEPTHWNLANTVSAVLRSLAASGEARMVPASKGAGPGCSCWQVAGNGTSAKAIQSAIGGKPKGVTSVHVVSPQAHGWHTSNCLAYRGAMPAKAGMRIATGQIEREFEGAFEIQVESGLTIHRIDQDGVWAAQLGESETEPRLVKGLHLLISAHEARKFGWKGIKRSFNLLRSEDTNLCQRIEVLLGTNVGGLTLQEIFHCLAGHRHDFPLVPRSLEPTLKGLRNAGYLEHSITKERVVTASGKEVLKPVGRWKWSGPRFDSDMDPHGEHIANSRWLVRPW